MALIFLSTSSLTVCNVCSISSLAVASSLILSRIVAMILSKRSISSLAKFICSLAISSSSCNDFISRSVLIVEDFFLFSSNFWDNSFKCNSFLCFFRVFVLISSSSSLISLSILFFLAKTASYL